MKRILGIAAALALFGAIPAMAHSYKAGPIEIGHPWARATAPSAPNGGAYLSLTNTGSNLKTWAVASSASARSRSRSITMPPTGIRRTTA